MKAIAAIIISCMLLSATCFAHQDRIITVKDDGTLEGIPPEYGPANLRIEFTPKDGGDAPRINSVILNLGKNHISIPKCVTGWLRTQRMSEIKASASWYHEEEFIPYYLKIDFYDPGYNKFRWANPGFSLLFNLRTGKLMKMEVMILRDDGNSIQFLPLDIAGACNEKFKEFSSGEIRFYPIR